MRLILWDIDQTLLDLRGRAAGWYRHALYTVTGTELVHEPVFAGRTERFIATSVLREHGISPSETRIERMFTALVDAVAAEAHTLHQRGRALPGAHEALTAVAAGRDAVQTLVTGNLQRVAEYKLAAFGLDEHANTPLGGFGDRSADRADVVAAAIDNVTRVYGVPEPVVVFGDSPADLTAAHANGAVAVGVTTGFYDAEALAAADTVLPDLADTARVLEQLTDGRG